MRYFLTIILLFFMLFICGCQKTAVLPEHFGRPFVCRVLNDATELEKNQNAYIRRKIPVRVQGEIKYYDGVLGQWAFLKTSTSLIYVDFSTVSANISLPKKKINRELVIEGYLVGDETVLNGFAVVPYAYEIATRNIVD